VSAQLDGAPALSFDAARHEYRVAGRVVPSVTQILAPLYDFASIPPGVLERKRQIGDAVHAAIALEAMGEELDPESIDPEIVGYLDGWRSFVRERHYTPILSEAKVYHRALRYAGTLDGAGTLDAGGKDGRVTALLDAKATYELHPAVGPQTAAYLAAAHDCGLLPKTVKARYALHLRPDGTYGLDQLSEASDFAVFQSALTLLNFKRRHNL